MPMKLSDQPIYEYACHEGNHSLPGILAGARRKEREALQAAAQLLTAQTLDRSGRLRGAWCGMSSHTC